MKTQLELSKIEEQPLNINDKVFLFDGSALTHEKNQKEVFIICKYLELTGIDKPLKDIECLVIDNNVKDTFCSGVLNFIYKQDIKIKIGKGTFYTNSGLVKLAENK